MWVLLLACNADPAPAHVIDECHDPEVDLLEDMVDFLEKNVNLGAVPPQTGAMK